MDRFLIYVFISCFIQYALNDFNAIDKINVLTTVVIAAFVCIYQLIEGYYKRKCDVSFDVHEYYMNREDKWKSKAENNYKLYRECYDKLKAYEN